jgi:predicted dehydrogenase
MNPKVAVVGCGYWGKNLVRNMQALGALHSVVEMAPANQAIARTLAPQARIHARLEEALQDGELAGVLIATPAETHYALARQALEAGKDVFVEKPLTLDVPSSRELVALARRSGRVLMVGHLLEYHPALLKLQELIAAGELGKVYYIISNRLNLGKVRTEENALWSFAPHDIAVILRLVGRMPFEVVATGGCYLQPQVADVSVTHLLFDNGVRAHIFVSWLHPFKEQRLVVIGSQKMASYDDVAKELILHDQHVDWKAGQPVPVKGAGVKVAFAAQEPLENECRHFLECIRERKTPRTDGENGVRVLQVLRAAQHSLASNGNPVQFPPAL